MNTQFIRHWVKQLAIRLSAMKHALSRWLSRSGGNPVPDKTPCAARTTSKGMLNMTLDFRLRGNDVLEWVL
jgi:hypothetical protein